MTRSVVVEPEIQAISDKFIAAFKKGDDRVSPICSPRMLCCFLTTRRA